MPLTGRRCRYSHSYFKHTPTHTRHLSSMPARTAENDEGFTVRTLRRPFHGVLTKLKIPRIPQKVLMARADVVQRVNSVLQASFGKRYSVALFGSTVYGTDRADSDLDMVLLVGQQVSFPRRPKLMLQIGLCEASRPRTLCSLRAP